eukprot:SAG22_NODE_3013_length_2027_cov_2.443465_3_plen_210_part_00
MLPPEFFSVYPRQCPSSPSVCLQQPENAAIDGLHAFDFVKNSFHAGRIPDALAADAALFTAAFSKAQPGRVIQVGAEAAPAFPCGPSFSGTAFVFLAGRLAGCALSLPLSCGSTAGSSQQNAVVLQVTIQRKEPRAGDNQRRCAQQQQQQQTQQSSYRCRPSHAVETTAGWLLTAACPTSYIYGPCSWALVTLAESQLVDRLCESNHGR